MGQIAVPRRVERMRHDAKADTGRQSEERRRLSPVHREFHRPDQGFIGPRRVEHLRKRAAIFEDIDRNLIVPHARGMATVLVLPPHDEGPERETWEIATGDEPHVDFVTDNLVGFLEGLVAPIKLT